TIRLSGSGGFADVRPVRDERDDRVSVDGDGVLRYDLHTFASIDGFDFRVTCGPAGTGGADRQRLAFHALFGGRPVADRIPIGDSKRSPGRAEVAFVRTACRGRRRGPGPHRRTARP